MSGKSDQSVFNKNRKFRSRRRSKRKFAGNRFVTASREPVEEEETVAEQDFMMPANENEDETVSSRPIPMAIHKSYDQYLCSFLSMMHCCYLMCLAYDSANLLSPWLSNVWYAFRPGLNYFSKW